MHEIYGIELTYGLDKLKQMITSYGEKIRRFNNLFRNYVEDNLDDITEKLWNNHPSPISVLDYYKELDRKNQNGEPINAVILAKELPRATDYYEDEFELISGSDERKADADFLFTLKLCYELDLDRTTSYTQKLQHDIFGTSPPSDPPRRLRTWTYLSGQYYSMHDAIRKAIRFSDLTKLRILEYLVKNFTQLILEAAESKNKNLNLK